MKPPHWKLLSCADGQEYIRLRAEFRRDTGKSRKGERLDNFTYRLNAIRDYVEHSEEDRWKRSLVCGVFFLSNSLALNIHQVSLLVGKCKSSINGSIQQLGYFAQPQTLGTDPEFLSQIPNHLHEIGELRKWTIRRRPPQIRDIPPPFIFPLPILGREGAKIETESAEPPAYQKVPCPVKWRYKFRDVIDRPMSAA